MWRCVGCILFLLATGERISFRFYFILFFLSNPPLQGEITAYASMTHHLAVRALDACHASLLRSWGVDPALLSTLSRQPAPIGSDHPWISKKELDEVATDVMALLHGGGSTILTYVVQPDGRIADCRVVVSSGLPSLDNFACQSFSINAHFDPALGADGQPVPVRVADIVHWAFI